MFCFQEHGAIGYYYLGIGRSHRVQQRIKSYIALGVYSGVLYRQRELCLYQARLAAKKNKIEKDGLEPPSSAIT